MQKKSLTQLQLHMSVDLILLVTVLLQKSKQKRNGTARVVTVVSLCLVFFTKMTLLFKQLQLNFREKTFVEILKMALMKTRLQNVL